MSYSTTLRDDPSTLNEMETKISSLERSNFDLKLRLHYLNKKYMESTGTTDVQGGLGGGLPQGQLISAANHMAGTSHGAAALGKLSPNMLHPEINAHILEGADEKSLDLLQQREENDFLKRRVIELESNNLQLQLLRDHDQQEYQKILSLKPSSIIQQEEHRKREREVAMAIAEHDAALIKKLQEELTFLSKQKESDQMMIENLSEQLTKKSNVIDDKDKEISRLHEINKDLHHQLEMVFDRQKLMDMQSTNQLHFNQALTSGNGNSSVTGSNGTLVPLTSSGASPVHSDRTLTPMVFSAASNGKQTSILINSNSFTTAANIGGSPSSNQNAQSITYPPITSNNTSFVLQSHDQVTSFNMGVGSPTQGRMMGISTDRSFQGSSTDTNQQVITLTESQPVNQLRDENSLLKQRLFKLQSSIESQDAIIRMLKTSASELNSMGTEEIKRLETEYNQLLDEKERLRQSYTKLQIELEFRTQELVKYRKVFGDVDSVVQGRSNNEGGIFNKEAYERTIDLYRQREHELLIALEGVVKRCQELESLDQLRVNSEPLRQQQLQPQALQKKRMGRESPMTSQPQSLPPTPLSWQHPSMVSQSTPVSSITNSPFHLRGNHHDLPAHTRHGSTLSPNSNQDSRSPHHTSSFYTSSSTRR